MFECALPRPRELFLLSKTKGENRSQIVPEIRQMICVCVCVAGGRRRLWIYIALVVYQQTANEKSETNTFSQIRDEKIGKIAWFAGLIYMHTHARTYTHTYTVICLFRFELPSVCDLFFALCVVFLLFFRNFILLNYAVDSVYSFCIYSIRFLVHSSVFTSVCLFSPHPLAPRARQIEFKYTPYQLSRSMLTHSMNGNRL